MQKNRNTYYLPWLKQRFERLRPDHPELGKSIRELCGEISYYLAAHRAAGIPLDTKHLEVIFSDGITVVLRQTLGVWVIFRIVLTKRVRESRPVFGIQRVKVGAQEALTRVLKYWKRLFDAPCVALL